MPHQTLFAAAMACIVLGLWNEQKSIVSKILSWSPMSYFGKMSYGLYLYHLYTWDWPEYFGRGAPIFPKVIIRLAFTFILAIVSWHWLKEPVNRLKKYLPY
jgi:peptidoglycan/LPS O-acetylase OafA/YrhL